MGVADEVADELLDICSIRPAELLMRSCNSPSDKDGIKDLARSINQHGLIQPITVRPVQFGFEIVAGHRRFEACKFLRWKAIPARVRELTEKEAFEIQLIENIQRKTMNPIEEAEAFSKYVLDYGWGGASQLARIITKSEQYVSGRIQLLKLPKELMNEVLQNRLKASHAVEIVNLNEDEQRLITDSVISENLSVQEIRDITRHSRKRSEEIKEPPSYSLLDNNKADATHVSIMGQIRLLKKTQLYLKISLARLDHLIHEANEKLDFEDRNGIVEVLMQFRLKIHSMIGKNMEIIAKLNKKI